MSALQLIVTAAGYAAIVNAENTGTGPVLVSQIGITDQVFTADASTAAIPGELKRLATFGGAAVADDTIHVTIRDDSADSYTLRGFGLYSAANVLLAVYSHAGETPDFIMQKAAAAMLLLQTDVRFTGISATSITFGNADFLNPPATETVPGVVQFATDAIIASGTDNTRAIHSKGLKALLDSRFGNGAPSAFVKSLLSITTAALLRTALELKGAALKDEGANNGLDADLLDGQHGAYYLAWGNLTGKPATFAPSAHGHTWADISDPPATAARWPAWGEVTGKPVTFAPSAHTHAAADITAGTFADARIAQSNVTQHQAALAIAWTQVTGKPVTFAPSAHTHAAADITTGTFADARIGQSNVTQHQAALAIAWAQVTGKPVTFAPSAHTHAIGDVNGLQGILDAKYQQGSVARFNDVYCDRGNGTGVCFLNGTGTRYLYFDGGTYIMPGAGLTLGGALAASGGYDYGSSRKLKEIDGVMPYGLAEVRRIVTLIGRYKPEYNDDGRTRLFFDAEQFLEVMPEVVNAEAIEFNGERVPAIKLDQVMPPAYRAIAQLADLVDNLRNEIEQLKAGR